MNKIQLNYFEEGVLYFGLCSNKKCSFHLSPFSTKTTTRCPLCNEPAELPSSLAPTINLDCKSNNIFERYFTDEIVNLFKDQFAFAKNIGNTPLSQNKKVSEWAGIENLFLKQENKNPSGSFKDRGSFTAIAFLSAKLKKENKKDFILGTVSTGNMAISTAYLVNQVNKNSNLKSFIVVSSTTPENKINAIQEAGDKTGTKVFVVDGEYSKLHQEIYAVASELRENQIPIFPQLTDDVFRIVGYSTLFAEIIEQTSGRNPDFIVLPVASGALFRVAVWALESLFIKGFIKKIPRIILVQEEGADPIINAMEKNLESIESIGIQKNTVADGIDVSFSRSGNPVLSILKDGYHLGINVNPSEIIEAQKILNKNRIFVEEASASSLAAVKKLRQLSKIQFGNKVICVLTGADIKHRNLGKKSSRSNVIYCQLTDLKKRFFDEFCQKQEDILFSYFS